LWGFEINTSDDLDSNRGIAIADSMDLN